MALKNGNRQAHGGKRKGAGRKPKLFTQLKHRIESERKDDAEYAFSLFASVMRDPEQSIELRLDCGREVMNRVLGKPQERHELSGEVRVKAYATVSPDDWDHSQPDSATT